MIGFCSNAGVFGCELPVGFCVMGVAVFHPGVTPLPAALRSIRAYPVDTDTH